MTYRVNYLSTKVLPDGSRGDWIRGKETQKFTNRKNVFEFINNISDRVNHRWATYLHPGEKLEISDVEILEDNIIEITLPSGRIVKKRDGFTAYTPGKYAMTFCKICGRILTDPLSVSRGIGPECIKKIGVA